MSDDAEAGFSRESGQTSLEGLRIAIVGLGLMGGSLAMALRGKCRELIGIDPHAETLALARQLHLCSRLSDQAQELLPEADLIVLAAPVKAILSILTHLQDFSSSPAVVLDLGSTKTQIVKAMRGLPANFDPIGGHPMCGKEHSTLVEAEAGLFQGAAFALTTLPRTSQRARQIAQALVCAVGAHPVWMNETKHDRWVAATSHLPFLVANALAAVTPFEAAPMLGPGYRSTTRVATTPSSVMLDILTTNQDNVLECLSRFRLQIDALEASLKSGNFEDLKIKLEAGSDHQKQLLISAHE